MQNATAVPRDGGSGVPAVRNLDPRMKLLIVLVVGSAALFSPHRALLLWCYAIIAALWLLSGEARRALGFVAVLAAVALAEWGAGFIPNATVAGMVGFLFFIFARSLRNLVLHPGRSLEYVLVPLIIRTIKIADDLAASAMTRGLDLVGARTTYRDVRIGASGALVTAAVLVCTAAGYVAWAVNVL